MQAEPAHAHVSPVLPCPSPGSPSAHVQAHARSWARGSGHRAHDCSPLRGEQGHGRDQVCSTAVQREGAPNRQGNGPIGGKGSPDIGNSIPRPGSKKESPAFQIVQQCHQQQVRLKVRGLELCLML